MEPNNNLNGAEIPRIVSLNNLTPDEFILYYQSHLDEIQHQMEHGAVKFTGVQIDSQNSFQHIVNAISDKFMNYIDGNSPRTKLSGNVYTSTEYDQTQRITMHNELSYSAKWPGKLFFSCLEPAASGGETLLADSRAIFSAMDKTIVNEIKNRGVMYIRNLHGGTGIGPSWQDTFETGSKTQLESYCQAYDIRFEWSSEGDLKLKQFSRGIIKHRHTGEDLWFNQIDQFHPVQLGEEMLETLEVMYDSPEQYPMYVTFGDGTPINKNMVSEILNTINSVTIAPEWEKNELLIVDNEMIAHGRNPYTGKRKVVVAMSE